MHGAPTRRLVLLKPICLIMLMLCIAAAQTATATDENESKQTGKYAGMSFSARIQAHLKTCDPLQNRLSARISEAGAGDPQFYTVDQHPYLRTNRFLASFTGSLDSPWQTSYWLAELRANAGYARDVELSQLGMSNRERLETLRDLRLCAVWLSRQANSDPDKRDDLMRAVAETPARPAKATEGSDRAGTSVPDAERRRQFSRPLMKLENPDAVTHWIPETSNKLRSIAGEVIDDYRDLSKDPLNRIGMTTTQWRALATHYAPRWVIETESEADTPGRPTLDGNNAAIKHSNAVVHYQITYARLRDRTLTQISYFLWMGKPERVREPDGVIWRVTLDADGKPMVYESLDMNGSNHFWYPIKNMTLQPDANAIIPQAQVPADPVEVHLRAADHLVRRVTKPNPDRNNLPQTYTLQRYEELVRLQNQDKRLQSLFGPDGRVRGAERPVDDAPRYFSRISLAPRELWYFDDPALLRNTFELPSERVSSATAPTTPGASGRQDKRLGRSMMPAAAGGLDPQAP